MAHSCKPGLINQHQIVVLVRLISIVTIGLVNTWDSQSKDRGRKRKAGEMAGEGDNAHDGGGGKGKSRSC